MDTRRLVLGDWTPWLRDGIDLLRLTLLGGAVGYAAVGDLHGAVVLAATGVATLVARAVNLPRLYDLAFVLAMSVQGWGEASGAYLSLPWFDEAVHLWLPFLTAPVLYLGLARLDVLRDPQDDAGPHHYAGIVAVTFALGTAAGVMWEGVEFAADTLAGSHLQEGNTDTVTDLFADAVGSLAGAALLVLWTRFSWGSVRRVPGENRFEDTEADRPQVLEAGQVPREELRG